MGQFHGAMTLQTGPEVTPADEQRWNEGLPELKRRLRKRGLADAEIEAGVLSVELMQDGSYARVLRITSATGDEGTV